MQFMMKLSCKNTVYRRWKRGQAAKEEFWNVGWAHGLMLGKPKQNWSWDLQGTSRATRWASTAKLAVKAEQGKRGLVAESSGWFCDSGHTELRNSMPSLPQFSATSVVTVKVVDNVFRGLSSPLQLDGAFKIEAHVGSVCSGLLV